MNYEWYSRVKSNSQQLLGWSAVYRHIEEFNG